MTIKNSDDELQRGNSSHSCFLLFDTELHLSVRNLEKVPDWCLQLGQKNLDKWNLSACCKACCLLWDVKWGFKMGCVRQHAILADWLSSLSPYWTNRLHTNTFIFIPFGILCQIIHFEKCKNWDAFPSETFTYILWIVEQAQMHPAGWFREAAGLGFSHPSL